MRRFVKVISSYALGVLVVAGTALATPAEEESKQPGRRNTAARAENQGVPEHARLDHETLSEAIRFERYKEQAAKLQARKDSGRTSESADRPAKRVVKQEKK